MRLSRILCLFFGGFLSMAFAQSYSSLVGYLFDPTGASVVGARVQVQGVDTGLRYEAVTDDTGAFLFPQLPVGRYSLTVEQAGFRRYEQRDIQLRVGERPSLRITLELGELTESVTVQEAPPLVNTANSTLGTVVDRRRIQELPLNGRDPLQLMSLVAGVTPTAGTFIRQAFTYASTFVSSSGGRGNTVNFTLDGGNNNDSYTNVAMPFPNPDALGEFQFKVNSFSAEYGNNSGGAVDAVIRSGTNQLHGSLFHYLRNFNLNATNFFTPGRVDGLKRNQYGFAVGGPVILPKIVNGKDRTFFFTSYQGTKLRVTPPTTVVFSPSEAHRRGDFSSLPAQLVDPDANRAPFPGNQIPVSRFDRASVRLLEWLPTPPPGQTNVFVTRATKMDEYQWIGKLDHSFSDRQKLYASYVLTDQNNIPSLVPNNIFSAVQGVWISAHTANLGLNSIFSPTLLNNVHLSFSRQDSPFRGVSGPDFPTTLGIEQPNINPGTFGSVSVSGFFSAFNGWFPNRVVRNQLQARDSATWITGRHELKFGGEWLHRQKNLNSFFLAAGSFSFGGNFSGSNLSDFFLGRPSSYTLSTNFDEMLRLNQWNFYIQDNFRVSRRLTLNLGLRYEPFLPWFDDFDGQVQLFRPGQQSQRFPNAPRGLVFERDPGVPRGGIDRSLRNFAPRFGFALDPGGDGKMAIRMAYGIFYELPNSIITNRFVSSQPFVNRVDITPPRSFSQPFAGRPPFGAQVPRSSGFVFTTPVLAASYPHRFHMPYVQQWNLTIERQLPFRSVARAAYAGSKGTHLIVNHEMNPAIYAPGATVATTDQRRIYQPFASIEFVDSMMSSNYHSLQLTWEKQYSHGLTLLANYTWQKSIDLQSNTVSPGGERLTNPFRHRQSRGPSDYDRTHRFVMSGLWSLPELRAQSAPVRLLVGGWQANAIVTLATGLPFSITSGRDNSLSGVNNDLADQIRPNAYLPEGRPTQERILRYFDTDAFTFNALGTFGNTTRNLMRGPGQANVDFSMFKNFPLREAWRLQFRAEFFNFFNRVNFANPVGNRNSPNFGRILSAGDPRITQLALRLEF